MAKDRESKEDLNTPLDRAKGGDREAFEQLINKEAPRLESFIRSRLGIELKRSVEIKDILQETLLRAYRLKDRFLLRDEDSLLVWLRAIAEHVILEAASGQRRHGMISLNFEVIAKGASPSRILRRNERFDRLQRALDALTPDQREVIHLVRMEGLPVREAAGRMNRSPHAVSNLLLRATQRLREIMGQTESFSLPHRFLKRSGDKSHA